MSMGVSETSGGTRVSRLVPAFDLDCVRTSPWTTPARLMRTAGLYVEERIVGQDDASVDRDTVTADLQAVVARILDPDHS